MSKIIFEEKEDSLVTTVELKDNKLDIAFFLNQARTELYKVIDKFIKTLPEDDQIVFLSAILTDLD